MNPFTVLPPVVRAYVYLLVFVVGLAFTAWQTAEGNWVEAVASLTGTLTSALAGSNVNQE